MRLVLVAATLVMLMPLATANPDLSIPAPRDVTVDFDEASNTARVAWTAPELPIGTEASFNVYLDGALVAQVDATQTDVDLGGALVSALFSVTTLVEGRESLPAVPVSSTSVVLTGCEFVSVGLGPTPPALGVHDYCIRDIADDLLPDAKSPLLEGM